MAKAPKRKTPRKKTGAAAAKPGWAKIALLVAGVVLLFGFAFYGLLSLDASDSAQPDPAHDDAPPVGHIDESSRDALREILREEAGE